MSPGPAPHTWRWRLTGLATVLATTAVVITAGAAPADQNPPRSPDPAASGAGQASPCPTGAATPAPQRRAPLPGDRSAARSAIEPPADRKAAPIPGSPTTPGSAQAPPAGPPEAGSRAAIQPQVLAQPGATDPDPATTSATTSAQTSPSPSPTPSSPPPTSHLSPPPTTRPSPSPGPSTSPAPCPAPPPLIPGAAPDAEIELRHDVRTTATIRKLRSEVTTTPGLMNTTVNLGTGKLSGTLAIPPTRSYFIVLGFVPHTATLEFEPDGPATGTLPGGKLDITVPLRIRLRDVRQDTVPVEVGAHCRTSAPAVFRLLGELPILPNTDYRYTSVFEIPPFTGCGVREDLSPLFTGLVAGPDNRVITTLRLRP